MIKRMPYEKLNGVKTGRHLSISVTDSSNVLTVRKRSVSNKAPSRIGNQPHCSDY